MKTQERPQSPLQGRHGDRWGTISPDVWLQGQRGGSGHSASPQVHRAMTACFSFPPSFQGSRLPQAGHLFLTREPNVTSSRRWPRGEEGD